MASTFAQADAAVAAHYAEDLRRVVRGWRLDAWRRLTKRERASTPAPSDEVSDDFVRLAWVLVRAYRGAHHVPGRPKIGHRWIEVVDHGQPATTDGNLLTRLVVLAHDAGVRVEVSGAARCYLRIMLHPRARTTGNMTNHPRLEEHAIAIRNSGEECPIAVPEGER